MKIEEYSKIEREKDQGERFRTCWMSLVFKSHYFFRLTWAFVMCTLIVGILTKLILVNFSNCFSSVEMLYQNVS